jgi:CBS domain-containing protein
MKVSDFSWREPVTIGVSDTIEAAARLLADAGIGSLVVVDGDRPVGVVTDRDLVVRALARGVGPDGRVDGVMSMGVVALDADDDVEELYAVFGRHAIRRVPVVDRDRVVGMISLDDALVSTASQLGVLSGVLSTQIDYPHARDEAEPPAVVPR